MMEKDSVADLKKVTDHLKNNPMSNMMQVHMATGVPIGRIHDFVRYGILKIKGMKAG